MHTEFSIKNTKRILAGSSHRARQKGVTLIIALIALVILLFSGVALVRSFEASTRLSGNLAFKRDMMNQAERGLAKGIAFVSAQMAAPGSTTLENDVTGSNYWATTRPSNVHGIPNILIDDSTFTGAPINDISDVAAGSSGVTIRYVIDRQCVNPGAYTIEHCAVMRGGISEPGGGHETLKSKAESDSMPVFRVTVRVTGPQDTRAYAQTTFSPKPL